MTRLQISTIDDEEMNAMREAADKALRGISFPRCTQQDARPKTPILPTTDQGYWGRKNGQETELEAAMKRPVL